MYTVRNKNKAVADLPTIVKKKKKRFVCIQIEAEMKYYISRVVPGLSRALGPFNLKLNLTYLRTYILDKTYPNSVLYLANELLAIIMIIKGLASGMGDNFDIILAALASYQRQTVQQHFSASGKCDKLKELLIIYNTAAALQPLKLDSDAVLSL